MRDGADPKHGLFFTHVGVGHDCQDVVAGKPKAKVWKYPRSLQRRKIAFLNTKVYRRRNLRRPISFSSGPLFD